MMKNHLRRIAAAALAVPLLVGTASVADAGTKSSYKSSGKIASISWIEMGATDGAGETEILLGDLSVMGDKLPDAFGSVYVYSCSDGETPGGGGHGEEPVEGACDLVESRWIFAEPGAITLTMDRKLTTAKISGRLTVYGDHDGEAIGFPMANITLTGFGVTSTSRDSGSYTDSNGQRYSYKSTNTGRQGVVTGSIGAMVFDDEPGESSWGYFGSFRSMDRSSTP
ncbi:MAG: hypothetical protein ABR616_00240 [Dermatophilaceae bacterium]|nr:hypothetical protein [Intrasporangiaceae bacterium]